MLKINIAGVGRLKEKFYTDAVNEYLKRLSKYAKVTVTEIPDFSDELDNSVAKEGQLILKSLKGHVVLLDLGGETYTSEGFAVRLQKLTMTAGEITFVIGGSRGVSDEVKMRADESISFSAMTFPHQLFRVILLEQIYRACTIINNASYHK